MMAVVWEGRSRSLWWVSESGRAACVVALSRVGHAVAASRATMRMML